MQHHLRTYVVSVLLSLLLGACRPVEYSPSNELPLSTPPPLQLDQATAAELDAIVAQSMADYPVPGMELCVVQDGSVVYNRAFGLADVADGRAVTPQSAVLQGSVTKPLTAMAIMHLAEQGLIDLDAPVTTYLPAFTMADARYQDITVRMLLSHRAGLPDSPDFWPTPLDPAVNGLDQAVSNLANMHLLYAPDPDFTYSSYGYSMLGAIISAVTGKSYETHMQEAWLDPLGMTHAGFDVAAVDPSSSATLYHGRDLDHLEATPSNVDGRDVSAGSLRASCDDMAQLAQMLLNQGQMEEDRFLEPASIDAMWTPQATTYWATRFGPALAQYGLGWFLGEQQGHRLVGHLGLADGANAQILIAPDDGLAIIAMGNWMDLQSAAGWPAMSVAVDVMDILLSGEAQ